jgi:hypothetical protein
MDYEMAGMGLEVNFGELRGKGKGFLRAGGKPGGRGGARGEGLFFVFIDWVDDDRRSISDECASFGIILLRGEV